MKRFDLMQNVSIIVPAHNEEANIPNLVQQLHRYQPGAEIIIVDDHSTDKTAEVVKKLEKKYEFLRLIKKKGPKGKTTALLQGFTAAKGEIIGMIDADLQYPPSAIPKMVKLIREGKADLVIGKRIFKDPNLFRRFLSLGFTWFFGKFLLGIPATDIQSGEKVFRKEILDDVDVKARRWGFDVEFLFKAKQAGYGIAEVPIVFSERKAGMTKINVVNTIIDLTATALRLFVFRR